MSKTAKLYREASSLIILARKKMLSNSKFNYNVLLFNRSDKSSFMANHAVFPGGVFEKSDESKEWLSHFQKFGINDQKLEELTKVTGPRPPMYRNQSDECIAKEISLRITAIRETFEEVGVLLCKSKNSNTSIFGEVKENFDRLTWQKAVHNDPSKFLSLCQELDVVPDLWSLHEWSAWFTPATFHKRFETAFYIVSLNQEPNLIIEEHEVKKFNWKTPDEYFESFEKKELWLPPPQYYELSRLSQLTDIEEVAKFSKDRGLNGTTLYLPVQYQCNDDRLVGVLPGDDFYPDNPNECTEFIKVEENTEEFRQKAKNRHRSYYQGFHKHSVEMNIPPFDGHLVAVERPETIKSKL